MEFQDVILGSFLGLQIRVCKKGFQKGSNESIPFLEAFCYRDLRRVYNKRFPSLLKPFKAKAFKAFLKLFKVI